MAYYIRLAFRILRYALLVALAFAVGAMAVLTLNENGRRNLDGLISDMISSPGQTIRVSGLRNIWSGPLTLDRVSIADAEGTWLTVENAAVDWSLWPLLTGTFRADSIKAGKVDFRRPPLPGTEVSEGGGGLPVDLDLRAIELPNVVLGPDIAGGAAVSVGGSAFVQGDPLRADTKLAVSRIDGHGGQLDATIGFAPDDNRLDVDVTGSEPAGGLLAGLLRLPGAPPVAVSVKGAGPLSDWSGKAALSVDGAEVTTLDVTHRQTPQGRAVTAKGDGSFANLVPEQARIVLAGQTAFDIAATLLDAGGFDVERATLESGAVRANAHGTIDFAGASDFVLELAARDAPVDVTLSPQNVLTVRSLSARAFGDGSEPMVDITADLPGVLAGNTRVERLTLTAHSDGFSVEARRGPLAAEFSAGSVTVENAAAITDAAGTVTSTDFDLANLAGPFAAAIRAGRVAADDPTLAPLLAGQVTVEATGALEGNAVALGQANLRSDAASVQVAGRVGFNEAIALDVSADVLSAALPEAVRDRLAERVTASGKIGMDEVGNFSAQALSVASGELTATGSARIEGETIAADLKGGLSSLGRYTDAATGAVAFEAKASGRLAAPDIVATVTSDRVEAAGQAIDALKLDVTGRADAAAPDLAFAATGTVAGQGLDAKGRIATRDGRQALEDLVVALGQGRVSGALVLDEKTRPLGELSIAIPDLTPFAALAAQALSGDLTGKVNFAVTDDVPVVSIEAGSNAIRRGEDGANGITISAVARDYLAALVLSGTVRAETATAGGAAISGVVVDLSQDGAWTRFDGGASVNGIPAKLAGRVRVADGQTTVELQSAEAAPLGIAAALARPATVTVRDGVTRIDGLSLGVGGGSIDVSGTVGDTLAIDIALADLPTAIAQGFVPGLEIDGTVSGTVGVRGTTAAPLVEPDVAVALRRLKNGDIEVEQFDGRVRSSGFDVTTLSGPLAVDFSVATLRPSAGVEIDGVNGTLETEAFDARAQRAALRLTANARAVTVAAVGTFEQVSAQAVSDGLDIAGRTGPFRLTAAAERADATNQTLAALLAGRLTADVEGALEAGVLTLSKAELNGKALTAALTGTRFSLDDGSLATALTADVATAALPEAIRARLAERLTLAATVNRGADGNLAVEPLTVRSGALVVDGSARLAGETLDATIGGSLAALDTLTDQAQGAVDFSLTAKGPVAAPDLALSLTSPRLEAAGQAITDLKLEASGKADLANPAAQVALSGAVGGQPLKGSAVLKPQDGRNVIDALSLSLGPNRIEGSLVLDQDFTPVGTIDLRVPDLAPLAALAGERVDGDVAGTIRFTREGGVPAVAVNATTSGVRRADLAARGVAIDASVRDYLSAPIVSGTVRAAGVTTGTTQITGIEVKLSQDGPWTAFDGKATASGIPAEAAGRVRVDGGTTVVELRSGAATVEGVRATIAAPSTVRVTDGTVRLERLTLGLSGGSAVIDGTAGSNLDLNVSLNALPASIVNAFSPGLDATGTISGRVAVGGAAANPTVRYDMDWGGAGIQQTRDAGFGSFTVRSNGTFANNRLNLEATAADGAGLSLNAGGSVDIGARSLNIDVRGPVPFAFLSPQLAAQGLALSGTSQVDLQVRGGFASPQISGSVRSSGARFIDSGTGIAVNDITMNIGLSGDRATISQLTGSLSSGGSIAVTGSVGITPGSGFPADIAIRLNDGRYSDGRLVTANLSGNLAVKGPLLSGLVLSGNIDLARTVVTIPERLPGSLSEIDVKHKNASAAVKKQAEELRPASSGGGSGGGGMQLDLTVNAPQQIFVQGRGIDVELGGSIRLQGAASAPEAVGQFTLRRGRLSIIGRRLDFTEGTLTFSGSLVPVLDLTATSTVEGGTVSIVVTGPATNPEFAFESVPALPQDEILARLVFGRSMSNLSPVQIAQLAEAAAQIAGIGGPTSLLNSLRSKLGVDDLDLKTNEKGQTAVSVGKYLNDRTYVTIEAGESGNSKATINLDIGRGVKLKGEAGAEGQAKGGIYYEREY